MTSGGGTANYQLKMLGISTKHTCDDWSSGVRNSELSAQDVISRPLDLCGRTVNYQLKMLGISIKHTCDD